MSPTSLPADPATNEASTRRRRLSFTTGTVISFSLTLLAASAAVLTNVFPLKALSVVERFDITTLLFMAPIMALILAIIFEATRLAFRTESLPQSRQRKAALNWTPGRREG